MPVTPSKSVLLVRDDELLREYLCKMPGDAGLQVAEATNAVEALDRMIPDEDSDVLVTDIHDVRSWDEWPCIDSAAQLRWSEFLPCSFAVTTQLSSSPIQATSS